MSQRRNTVRTILCCLLLLCIFAPPTHAQDQPSPGPPEAIVELVNDVRLGVRLESGFFHSRLSVAPFEERRMRYLDRPVSSDISPVTTPVYGVSAGLRAGDAELFGTYRLNSGLERETSLQFQDGTRAIPADHELRQWEVRAHYFVFESVGLGAVYRSEQELLSGVSSFTVAGEEVSENIFSGSSERQSLSLYVPARFQIGSQTTLLGKVGVSVYGKGDDFYSTRFTHFQDPDRPGKPFPIPPDGDTRSSIDAGSASLNRQFARLGVEHPFLGVTWRFMLHAERVSVGDVSEEWRGGARLQVGLPF